MANVDNEKPGGLAPDLPMLLGALAALVGYLMPWFKASHGYWWYSGWNYASVGGGWTWFTVGCLLLAAGSSVPAGRSQTAAILAVTAGVGGMFFALVGGGWTRFPIACLLLAIGGSLRAGRSKPAAMIAVTAGVGGMFFALSVVAASFGSMGPLDSVAEMPLGNGLPLMAGGFGLLLAGALRFRRPTIAPIAPQRSP